MSNPSASFSVLKPNQASYLKIFITFTLLMYSEGFSIAWKLVEISILVVIFSLLSNPNSMCTTRGNVTECEPFDMNLCLERLGNDETILFCTFQVLWMMKCLVLVASLLSLLFLLMNKWKMVQNGVAFVYAQPITSLCIYLLSYYLQTDWHSYWQRNEEISQITDILDHNNLNSIIIALLTLQVLFFCYSFRKLLKETWKA